MGLHPILPTPRDARSQHDQFLHFDRKRAVLAHTQAPDFRPGSGVGRIELRGPVHLAIAIGVAEVL